MPTARRWPCPKPGKHPPGISALPRESREDDYENRLSPLTSADGVFTVDADQRIVHWSESAQRILGLTAAETEGRPCHEVLGGRDSLNYRFCRRNCPVMANARRGRTTPDYDVMCHTSSGEERWLNVSIVIPANSRAPLRVVHLFRDVTQRRRTEEFARRASDALRRLIDEPGTSLEEPDDPRPTPAPVLSRREREALSLLATGMTTTQIADALGVRPITARNHITRVITKLGVENRLQAVVYASRHRLI